MMSQVRDAAYQAIRHDVAWRIVARDGIIVSGPGALDWLQGQLSQDVAGLREGATGVGLETLVLSPQGKIDSFCRICRLGTDRYLLDLRAGFGEALLERLRRFKLRVKADLELLEDLHSVELRGPGAEVASRSVAEAVSALATLGVDWPGWSGRDHLLDGAQIPSDLRSLGIGPTADDAEGFDAARIEAGVPQLGSELTERTIPQEAGELVARAVSFTKGCYTGQELVARIDARGSNTPRRLRGVVMDAPATNGMAVGTAPAAGDELRVGGEKVGELTSVAWSPGFSNHVALAYVKRGIEVPVQVAVVHAEGAERGGGSVCLLPLFGG